MRGGLRAERSRLPWRPVVALLALLAPLLALWWYQSRPAPPIELAECATPEAVTILEDSSPSVRRLDQADQRMLAVRQILQLLAAEPCTPDDVVTVISFTEVAAITGPSPPATIGRIERAVGEGTDIASAVEAGVNIAADRPGFRQIAIMLTDLEDGSGVPMDLTFDRLQGIDVVVVSIGDADPAGGVTEIDLRESTDITRRIAEVINTSRSIS